jgi:CubicO group peptidase (beta-lactamase class C family)
VLRNNPVGAIAALRQFNTRDAPAGTRFSYSSAETEVLGLVVSRAVRMPLADYLSTRIWKKLGAEADAAWAIDPTGQEAAYCCFIARLRDWARFGLMLAHDGVWNGQQIVPRQWIPDATTVPGKSYLRSTIAPSWGYGYQVWLLPGERRMFLLLGTNGQALFVDPESKLVLVQTAVRTTAGSIRNLPKPSPFGMRWLRNMAVVSPTRQRLVAYRTSFAPLTRNIVSAGKATPGAGRPLNLSVILLAKRRCALQQSGSLVRVRAASAAMTSILNRAEVPARPLPRC